MAKKRSSSKVRSVKESSSSVTIRTASNGFVISSFTERGEKLIIAKTKKEAKKAADKLLRI